MEAAGVEKKEAEPTVACESVASSHDSVSAAAWGVRTWGNDHVDEEKKRWDWQSRPKWRVAWTWSLQDAWLRIKWAAAAFIKLPMWKWKPWKSKHLFAVFLVAISAVVPLGILGEVTKVGSSNNVPFARIFEDKVIGCGGSVGGTPQNSTVTGIEKLFALDSAYGMFTFAQAKTIDILWDVVLGRGLQFLAAWATYIVFCDALLRAIERHPTSFAVFQRIALEGPSLRSLWTLMVELWAVKSRRTKALFFYLFWATTYVLSIPIVIGAMTGYDSNAIPWVDLDDTNNIVPASSLQLSWIIDGTLNDTWSQPGCADLKLSDQYYMVTSYRREKCDCMLPNGTIFTADQVRAERYWPSYPRIDVINCTYDYPNNTQTWEASDYYDNNSRVTYSCNSTVAVTVNGKTYDASELKTEIGFCHNSVGYNYTYLEDRSRCLPDTANQTYKWGFSTMLSGLFIFVTSVWVVTMYIVWFDAQRNSSLVREGYRMTPLRAAFAMVKAARQRTGLSDKELMRADTVALEKELYGGKQSKKTKVQYSIFAHDVEEGEDGLLATPRKTEETSQELLLRQDG